MTEYRKKSDGSLLLSTSAFKAANPRTSFPLVPTDSNANDFGYDIIKATTPPTPTKYQKVERDGVEQSGDNWIERWKLTTVDTTTMDNAQAAAARVNRNESLTNSDWSQIADNGLSTDKKAEWTTYRQKLRDLPTVSGWPWEHTLPTKPS